MSPLFPGPNNAIPWADQIIRTIQKDQIYKVSRQVDNEYEEYYLKVIKYKKYKEIALSTLLAECIKSKPIPGRLIYFRLGIIYVCCPELMLGINQCADGFKYELLDGLFIKNKPSGCTCVKCGDYNPYAESNQDDGSFICYSCRN